MVEFCVAGAAQIVAISAWTVVLALPSFISRPSAFSSGLGQKLGFDTM